ncbi:MAG: 3-hydroxyacyl-ACP dehydratase FabZ family protein [Phycisphaerales bacterium JB064]
MRWLWIDRILALEPGKRLLACKAISLSEPHLHQHFRAEAKRPAMPVVPAPLIIEGMAQAGGLLAGHARGFRDDVVLAKLRKAELCFEVLPGATIEFEATLTAIDDNGASVDGLVRVRDPRWEVPRELGAIDLMFANVPAQRDSLLIAEAFRTLISASVLAGGDGVAQMVI